MSQPSRSMSMRETTSRPALSRADESVLFVDTSSLPANLEAVWIRESVNGQRDENNLLRVMRRQGYRVATGKDLPGQLPPLLPGEKRDRDPSEVVFRAGGQILFLREKSVAEAERAYIAEETAAAVRSAQRISGQDGAALDGRNFAEDATAGGVTEKVERGSGRARFSE
jgi:hypothetical protein